MNFSSEVYSLIEKLQPRLKDYLALHNIEFDHSNKILCISKDHDEKTPSMAEKNNRLKCFGCGWYGDIIDAYYELNGHNISFIDALKGLCEELGETHNLDDLSPGLVRKYNTYQYYKVVSEAVTDPKIDTELYTKEAKDFCKARGWSLSLLKELNVGFVSLDTIKSLIDLPYEELKSYDLVRNKLFDQGKLVFTHKDSSGKVTGFSSRNIFFDEESEESKWMYTKSSLVTTFDKRSDLYNIYNCLKNLKEEVHRKVYVFEGAGDVLTAYGAGIKNCVSVGTSFLQEAQVHVLKQHAHEIVLCFDADKAGKNGLIKSILENVKFLTGTNLRIIELPEGSDPDSYIREHGADSFKELEEQPAFSWLLNEYKHQHEPEEIASELIPVIAIISSAIEREKYARELSEFTDFSLESVLSDINSIVNAKENNINNQKMLLLENIFREAKKNPSNIESLLEQATENVKLIEKDNNVKLYSGEYFINQMMNSKEENERKTDQFPGYKLPYMGWFENTFDNDWSRHKLILVGGDENEQPLTSKVLTNQGYKLMRDIQPGEQVLTPFGKSTKVLKIIPKEDQKTYRIHFTDRTYVESGAEHIWVVQSSYNRKKRRTQEVTAARIYEQTLKPGYKHARWSIPYSAPVPFEEKDLKVSPYLLGALLGDGRTSQYSVQFATADKEILTYIEPLLEIFECSIHSCTGKGAEHLYLFTKKNKASSSHRKNKLKEELLDLGLWGTNCHTKFIPPMYFLGSIQQRIQLLQGLMDTDGSVDTYGPGVPKLTYCTVSEGLAEGVAELVRSLGGKATVYKTDSRSHNGNGDSWKCGDSYYVNFRITGFNPFRLKRKAEVYEPYVNSSLPPRIIESVEVLEELVPMQCLQIEDPSRLYITDHYTPTHNCGKSSFCNDLAFNLVQAEENNVMAVYFTIDDSPQELFTKWIARSANVLTGFELHLNHIVNPRYSEEILKEANLHSQMKHAYQAGYKHVIEKAQDEWLVMCGTPDLTTLKDFKNVMRHYRNKYPNRNVIGILDNIMKLPLEHQDTRIAYKNISNELKNLTVAEDLSIICTIEYNSSKDNRAKGNRPTNKSLGETRAFRYDANAIVHIYNSLHENHDASIFYHEHQYDWYAAPIKMPRLELIVGKNKISSTKFSQYMDFYPEISRFNYVPIEQVKRDAINAKRLIEDQESGEDHNEDSFGRRDSL